MIRPVDRVPGSWRCEREVDWIGFVAMSIIPSLALYQGIVAALGILVVFEPAVESAAGLTVIGLCFLVRLPAITAVVRRPGVRSASIYLVAYILTIFASTVLVFIDPIERDPSRMTQQFVSVLPSLAMFFVMVSGPGPRPAIRGLKASLIVWMLAAAVTPLTAFTPLPIGEIQGTYQGSAGLRSFGVLGDGGTFVISFLTVAFLSSRRFFWFALCLFALVLSGSRMALVISAVGIGMVLVLANPSHRDWLRGERAARILMAIAPVIVVLIALQVLVSQIADQLGVMNSIERLRDSDISESDRFFSVLQGLEWFLLSPLYGLGFNSYYFFSLRSAAFGANQSNALNQMTQTLMDGGLLALGFLLLFFFKVIWPGRGATLIDRQNDPYAIKGWLLAFIILNQTAVYILPAFFLTAFIFGLAGLSLLLDVTRARVPAVRPTSTIPVAES